MEAITIQGLDLTKYEPYERDSAVEYKTDAMCDLALEENRSNLPSA